MLLHRQKLLLALLNALGGKVGGVDFQKLLFLYCLDVEESPSYDFVPYKYGGFSFTCYEDKRRMVLQGLLSDEDTEWRLTDLGRAAITVDGRMKSRIDRFAKRYAGLRGDDLVSEAYYRHPYYATRSDIVKRVLTDDAAALQAIEAARPSRGSPGLCTIGYEGRTIEAYLNTLIVNGVTLLCDVRSNPLSRKYGFSKPTLAKRCYDVGIGYEHLPELGIASEDRKELGSQADYLRLFEAYKAEVLSQREDSLDLIRSWVARGEKVALTCYESSAGRCHRHCVAAAMQQKFGDSFTTQHL